MCDVDVFELDDGVGHFDFFLGDMTFLELVRSGRAVFLIPRVAPSPAEL